MTALAAQDRGELGRWAISAVVVLAVHVAGAATLLSWPRRDEAVAPVAALTIDLAPIAASPPAPPTDLAPGPMQPEEMPPAPPTPKAEITPEPIKPIKPIDQPPPPKVEPVPNAVVTLAPPKPERVQKEVAHPPTQMASAPTPSNRIDVQAAKANWNSQIEAHLARFRRSPTKQGLVILAFVIDRQGHVLADTLNKSSGSEALDQEALAMVRRADPFPPPPPEVPGARLGFTVPIRFNFD